MVQSNAAMYVGYADDDEDVDSIMKKFKALEEIQKRSGNADGDESALDTTQLVNAVGLRVGCGVDWVVMWSGVGGEYVLWFVSGSCRTCWEGLLCVMVSDGVIV